MTIEVHTGGAAEVPVRTFHFACFGNFSGRTEEGPLERRPLNSATWDQVLAELKPAARATLEFEGVPDIDLHWSITDLADFRAKGMRRRIPFLKNLHQLSEDVSRASEERPVAVAEIDEDLANVLKTLAGQSKSEEFVDLLNMVDLGDDEGPEYAHLKKLFFEAQYTGQDRSKVAADLERLTSEIHRQINAHASVRALQGAWRGLHAVLKYFGDHVKLDLIDCMQEELCDALFLIYVKPEKGDPPPLDLAWSSFEFDHQQASITALHHLGRMAEHLNAPLILNAAPSLFDARSHAHLAHLRDVGNKLGGPAHVKWRALRDEPGAEWLFMAANPFVTGEDTSGKPILSPPANHLAAAIANRCNKQRWPGELLAAQGVLPIAEACAAKLDDHLANNLAYEGFCVIGPIKEAIGVKGMNNLARMILTGANRLDAGHLVPYTLAYRFYAGCCSRYFLGPFAEHGDLSQLAAYAGLESAKAIQTEQADGQTIVKFEAPFAIFGQQPELAMAAEPGE